MSTLEALHIVVGGGIGGLAAALALSQRGFRVLVLERAQQFSEIGAGIQLGPNVWPMFEKLAIAEEIKVQTVFPDQLVTMDAVSGQQITRIPLKDKFLTRFRYPYGLIHRADLHSVLFRKCETSPLIQLMTSQKVIGFVEGGNGVTVEVEGGGRYECAVLIGADGLWSTIRRQLIGDSRPRVSGHIAYRAVLPLNEVPEHLRTNSMTLWAGPNNHLVHYPMRGWKLFNVVAISQSDRYTEGWDTHGDPEELHRSFESVVPDVKTMLNKVDAWRMWVLCDRDPLRGWSRGRVTLLGDAAHPMLPYLAQGAAMSIEDAIVLADELHVAGDHNRGFAAYEQKRSARTSRAQLTSRQSGEFFMLLERPARLGMCSWRGAAKSKLTKPWPGSTMAVDYFGNGFNKRSMKRWLLLVTVLALGALPHACATAQNPPAGLSSLAVAAARIEKVKENLYVITGSEVEKSDMFSGGNTAVFITERGVVVVDTKLPRWGQVILDRIKSVTDKPVTTIINTHSHPDHTGSNEFFGASVESIVQENTKQNMSRMTAFSGDKSSFLPNRTFKDRLTLGAGKEQIDLYYLGAGHTNGDSFVVFPFQRTMHAGDNFPWKALPYIDAGSGGSVIAHPETLAKAVSTIKNVDTVITGHTPVLTWNDFVEYAEFTREFVEWGKNELAAGKAVDQAAAAYRVPGRYKGYATSVSPQMSGAKANLQQIYDELQR